MAEHNTQRTFFFGLLFLVTLAFFWLIRGFLQPIFWAVALGIIVYPAHVQLVQRLPKHPSLAAVISVITVVLLVILPLIGLGAAVGTEAAALVNRFTEDRDVAQVVEDVRDEAAADVPGAEPRVPPVDAPDQTRAAPDGGQAAGEPEVADQAAPDRSAEAQEGAGPKDIALLFSMLQEQFPTIVGLLESVGLGPERLQSAISAAALTASQFIAANALAIGQNTVRITIYFVLMLYLLFFFLRDGTRLLDGLVRALPLGDARERHLLDRFAEVARATIKGTLVVGVAQGTIGGIAFAVLGIGAPVLWGVLMALLSILPAVGPAVVWVPAAIFLFVQKQYFAGIVLVLIGVLVIGLVDNLLRPILVGRDTRMPDYLVLLSTLGGLAAFGLAGIVIGPIIAAFFLSVWEMAQAEFQQEEEAAHERALAAQTQAAEPPGVEEPPAPVMLGRLREPPGAHDDTA